MGKKTFTVTLFRSNGRFVKSTQRHSRYAAKKVVEAWGEKHDESFYIEVNEETGGSK